MATERCSLASLFADDDIEAVDAVEQEVDAATSDEPIEITPRNNPAFLGHEGVEKSLLGDFQAGRMPHALILAGPTGIGKATLAFRLARFLFSQADTAQGAGLFGDEPATTSLYVAPENPVFRRVASSGHADLLTIEREFDEKKGRLKTEISVESVRRIHPFLRLTAAENGWRVVIIDSAEYLNTSSQNALLKILEEPPEKAILILTTGQPGSFLPTIRSRCRMVHMEPLSEQVISALLDKIVPGLSGEEKASLSRLAQGSIGKALQFHADGGIALYRQLLDVVSTMPELDMVRVHDLAEKLGKYGAEQNYNVAMEIMTGWCERQARASARGQVAADILPGDKDIFDRIKRMYPPGHFLNAWEKISLLVRQTESYKLDKRQAIIGAFLALQRVEYQGLGI